MGMRADTSDSYKCTSVSFNLFQSYEKIANFYDDTFSRIHTMFLWKFFNYNTAN